jgi:hypothetical protein
MSAGKRYGSEEAVRNGNIEPSAATRAATWQGSLAESKQSRAKFQGGLTWRIRQGITTTDLFSFFRAD